MFVHTGRTAPVQNQSNVTLVKAFGCLLRQCAETLLCRSMQCWRCEWFASNNCQTNSTPALSRIMCHLLDCTTLRLDMVYCMDTTSPNTSLPPFFKIQMLFAICMQISWQCTSLRLQWTRDPAGGHCCANSYRRTSLLVIVSNGQNFYSRLLWKDSQQRIINV